MGEKNIWRRFALMSGVTDVKRAFLLENNGIQEKVKYYGAVSITLFESV